MYDGGEMYVCTYLSVTEAAHNIEYLRVSDEAFCFFGI